MAETPDTPTRRHYAKTEQVLSTLTKGERERLDDYAERNEVSRAHAIRTFITEGLDRDELQRGQVTAARAAGVVDLGDER